jgi:hypothetical protein
MRHFAVRPFCWAILAISLMVISVYSCASLPPAREAKEIRTIRGKWEGWAASNKYGKLYVRLTVKEDGKWDLVTDPWYSTLGRNFSGRMTIIGGQYVADTDTPGLSGIYSLHLMQDTRILMFKGDDGSVMMELRPYY